MFIFASNNFLCDKMINIKDNDTGIVKCVIYNEEYIFWTYADYIKPYIIDFLKERFPGKLIIRELNMVDLSIPEDNLPVEIQATIVQSERSSYHPQYSRFEQLIEKQINQDIVHGKCWFFFDSELLRSMKNAGKTMSINMVWFRNYMKEGKLKVFTVRYDGIIEEKIYKDFDFLSEISQTCKIAAKTDDMILNENKMNIYTNIVKTHGFTQDEIDKFYNNWIEYCRINKISDKNDNDGFTLFNRKQKDNRSKLYGDILHSIGTLPAINDILGMKHYSPRAKSSAVVLGIFDTEGGISHNNITRFIDRFNICQYFPGYMRNKDAWDKLKNHNLNPRQFESIIKNGTKNYFWYEEDKNNVMTESDEKIVNNIEFKIEDKDKIVTINIKTKQNTIEDAWNG